MKNSNQKATDRLTIEAFNLCAVYGPGDGVDPRYQNNETSNNRGNKSSSRLCNEVLKVLSLVLAGEMCNPILQSLQVINVVSVSDGQFLDVTVTHYETIDVLADDQHVVAELKLIQGYLRSAITQRINRKRVPNLKFRYIGFMEWGK